MENLNPHQFGDQGTLFDAPLGQPEKGIFKGNPHASIYRTVFVPPHTIRDAKETGDMGIVADHISRPGKDSGVDRSLGLHWQHDLERAKAHNFWGTGSKVIMEADHPGHEHVMTREHDLPTLEKTVTDVGAAHMLGNVLPEVPVRPGAPLHVRAIYHPAPNEEQPQAYHRGDDSARIWNRYPVNMKGRA